MMEDADDIALGSGGATKDVDLSRDDSLVVKIADALNESDIVKFTVQTKTTLDRFQARDFQVSRPHEDFVWLYDRFVENTLHAGFLIPPCPPKPDFSRSHGKLAKLQASDSAMPEEELEKLKQEIQSEYLAAFQKTVAMHETFLTRLVAHPVLREDENLKVFLEFANDLAARGRTNKEKALKIIGNMGKAIDGSFTSFKDTDEFFDQQRSFIVQYNTFVKDARSKMEKKVKDRNSMVEKMDSFATAMIYLGNTQTAAPSLSDVLRKTGEGHVKCKMIEKKLAAKEDLKMTDLLRYYCADGLAARDLMWRRIKAYNEMESTKKKLEQAKLKGKKVIESQDAATAAQDLYEKITKSAREELKVFKRRRATAFRKGLIQYTQAQIRQSREQHALWKDMLGTVKVVTGQASA